MAVVEIIEANLIEKENIETKVKKNACAYCRVSTDNEEQLTSYKSQIEHYSSMIKSNPELNFVGIYADEGITGTQMKKRDEFLRMIEDAKQGKIDIIYAKSISRFARNTVDTLNTVRLLRDLNVDVYFEKENIHTLALDSEMFLTLYSAFAQAESESTSMNVKMGYRAKMKRGEACGSIKCYGFNYDKVTKELTINPKEADVVRKIFAYYVSGLGSSRIAKKLEEEGIPAPKGGKKWSASVIKGILRNVKYIGDVLGQQYFVENPLTHKLIKNRGQKPKYYSKNHHDAIIDVDTWNKAQKIYDERSKVLKPDGKYCKKFSMRYPYSSKIECGICHKNYVRRVGRSSPYKGKKYNTKAYWRCSENLAKGNCDASKGIREEELNLMFVELFNQISSNYETSDDYLLNRIEHILYDNSGVTELKKLESDENKIKTKLLNLLDLKLDDLDNKELYEEKEKELKFQLEEIKDKIIKVQEVIVNKQDTQYKINQIKDVLKNTKKLKEFDESIFEKVIEKIIIGEKKDDGTKDYSVIRFVLKTGELAKFYKDQNENTFVSFESDEWNSSSFKMQLGGLYEIKRN